MTFRSKYNTTIRGRSKRTFEEYTLLAIISGAFKMLLVMGAAYLDKFSKLSLYDEDIYDFSFPSKKKKNIWRGLNISNFLDVKYIICLLTHCKLILLRGHGLSMKLSNPTLQLQNNISTFFCRLSVRKKISCISSASSLIILFCYET